MTRSINLNLEKLKQLQSYLRKKDLDFALLNSKDLFYFTSLINQGFLLLPKKGKPIIFLNPLELQNFVCYDCILKSDFNLLKNKIKSKKVGLNFNEFSLSSNKKLKCKKHNISNFLFYIKSIKTDEEIKLIKKSCNIAQKILAEAINNINKTLFTEKDIYKFLVLQTTINDCSLAFDPVVASGKHAAIPHALSSKNKLKKGFLVIDFGVKYKGYCSDITRTVYIGKPNKKEIDLYDNLLSVQKKAVIKVNDLINKKTSILDKFVRQELSLHNLADKFVHSLGHGFGSQIHECPFIGPKSNDLFYEGQVFTIEPGVYDSKKGYGIRIEDDFLIKNNKIVPLTNKLSKKLIIIDKN